MSKEGCRKPCAECPFSRKTTRGALGGAGPTTFIGQVHGPFLLSCHMDPGYEKDRRSPELLQCAGAATFRANIGVAPLMPKELMSLPADTEHVFATPTEFLAHHIAFPLETSPLPIRTAERLASLFLKRVPPAVLLQRELARQEVQLVDMKKSKI